MKIDPSVLKDITKGSSWSLFRLDAVGNNELTKDDRLSFELAVGDLIGINQGRMSKYIKVFRLMIARKSFSCS
jgi:hypothetical protein